MSDKTKTATFIAPDHFGPVELTPGMTLSEALASIGQNGDAIVKLNGSQQRLDDGVTAGAVYIVVPGSVAKGGFDGASN
jgi:hypothetical protein